MKHLQMHQPIYLIRVTNMRDIEITKREILISIVIVLLMLSVGFFISVNIHNNVSVGNEKYFKALKIDNNPDMFNHAINTEVGDIVSYGTFKANSAVSDSLIKGKYFSIIKIDEHYVMKTRIVTYTDANGNMQTRTETYWEWEEVKRSQYNTDSFSYLGKEFEYEKVKFKNHKYNKTVSKGLLSNVRWEFRTIPVEFNASLYSMAEGKTITKNELYSGQSIEELIHQKEKGADNAVVLFWIALMFVIVLVVGIFVAMDNKYINKNSYGNRRGRY